ncbi:MAG: DUF3863 domain-containing protein, partial [Acidobacteria bacterium]|nr:DUF3863 domain-containing protein [Acidobacteriota bacterium]
MLRRQFLASLPAAALAAPQALMGNRFLTFNSVIRVNQIEVSREKNAGFDEYDFHDPAYVEKLRQSFEAGWPGARMTWAFSWRALQDRRPRYERIRQLIAGYQEKYGDEITFLPGAYFANAYNSRDQVNRDLHEGLELATRIGGKRPRLIVAG